MFDIQQIDSLFLLLLLSKPLPRIVHSSETKDVFADVLELWRPRDGDVEITWVITIAIHVRFAHAHRGYGVDFFYSSVNKIEYTQ